MPREVVHDPFGRKSAGLGVSGEAILPSEVLESYGVGGNAEALIQAVREHYPPELTAALAKRENEELSDEARKALAGRKGAKWPNDVNVRDIAGEGADVLDVAVHGHDEVTYVAADALGVTFKGTFRLDDPEGTHVSQAEVLGRDDRTTSGIIGPRRAARSIDQEAEAAALAAREKAVARREQELAQREQAQTEAEAPAKPDRPAALPDNYDELDAGAAAEAVGKLADPADRQAAVEYEQATKKRKTVVKAAEVDETPPGGSSS